MTGGKDMELSKRLQAVANLVTAGYIFADIGTDHAYIPIFLVGGGKNPAAVAMDVNEGPLERARAHVRESGLGGKISLRLSDGFAALSPGEVQSAVVAGMGGALMIRLLKAGADVVSSLKECILQPQSEIEKVRTFLLEEGFLFIEEDMVFDEGKYYPMMKVSPPGLREERGLPGEKDTDVRMRPDDWKPEELRYGRLLLRKKDPVLKEFLEREIRLKKGILSELSQREGEKIQTRREELAGELQCAEKGMKYYAL